MKKNVYKNVSGKGNVTHMVLELTECPQPHPYGFAAHVQLRTRLVDGTEPARSGKHFKTMEEAFSNFKDFETKLDNNVDAQRVEE